MSTTINRKRIVKNTALLYFRMLVILAVNLFVVRIVLDTLGEEDYGIFNVVGGVVLMFAFLSSTMANASQRFFAVELGKGNIPRLKQLFSLNLILYGGVAIIIFILAESIGLWFLNTQMTIPPDRMEAANWVYQFSVLSFMITILAIPYNAVIVAREKMNFYAYISIVEALLRLAIVYLLLIFDFDKLKLYAILTFGVTVITNIIYFIYCNRKLEECRFRFYWEKNLFRELLGYSGWNIYGTIAGVFNNQGINILLNLFFGPVVNAARGIAAQANSAITRFVSNFYTAVYPQITKSYAAGEHEGVIRLVFQTSKFCFFLMLVLSLPVIIEIPFLLDIWLKDVPDYAVLFTRLIVFNTLIDTLSYPMTTLAQATGRIRKFQLWIGTVQFMVLPVAYILLKSGFSPEIPFYVSIVISVACLFLRVFLLREMVGLPAGKYLRQVVVPVFTVSVLSSLLPLTFFLHMDQGFVRLLTVIIATLISVGFFGFTIGLTGSEKQFIIRQIKRRMPGKK